MKYLLVLALVIAFCFSVPIPTHPDGYLYKPAPLKTVRLDVYEDILCGDCKNFEPGFKKYLNTAKVDGKPVTDYVETVVHMFPLPYHHHAFILTQLVPFVFDINEDSADVFEYTDWVFSVQDAFLAGATDMSEPEVQKMACTKASEATGLFTYDDCMKEYATGKHSNNARVSWKFGAYNGVNGTPTVFLNGIEVDAPMSEKEWAALLKDYLPGSDSSVKNMLKN